MQRAERLSKASEQLKRDGNRRKYVAYESVGYFGCHPEALSVGSATTPDHASRRLADPPIQPYVQR